MFVEIKQLQQLHQQEISELNRKNEELVTENKKHEMKSEVNQSLRRQVNELHVEVCFFVCVNELLDFENCS